MRRIVSNYKLKSCWCWIFAIAFCAIIQYGYGKKQNYNLDQLASIVLRRGGRSFYQAATFERDQTIFSNSPLLTVNQRKLCGIRIDKYGNLNEFDVAKQIFANTLHLPLRDLRIVDPSYPNQIQATILARQNAILFSVDSIKIIIKKDEAFIFNTNHSDVKHLLPLLQQQLVALQSHQDTATPSMDYGEESPPNYDKSSILSSQRFEQVILDISLNLICSNLASSVRSLEPSIAAALLDLRVISKGLDAIQTQVDELLPLKNKIDEIRKRCQEIKRCVLDLLHSDDDLEMMALSSSSSPPLFEKRIDEEVLGELSTKKDHQRPFQSHGKDVLSVELLLENYLNEVEWITSEVDDVLDEITNTEENVVLQLDLIRNRILKFELLLSISSFVVTCGALITGLFGMNLLNHFELHRKMFYIVSAVLFVGMALSFRSLISFARNRKLL